MEDTDLNQNSTADQQPLLFILRHSPYSSSLLSEGLDAILAALSYDQSVEVLIADDAVLSLLEDQNTEYTGQKNIAKVLSVLPIYGLERIWVCKDSVEKRCLSTDDIANHSLPLMLVGYDAQKVVLNEAKHIFTF